MNCWTETLPGRAVASLALLGLLMPSAAVASLPPTTATLATLKGRPITMGEFSAHSQTIGSIEGRIFPSMYQAFEDYLITLSVDDFATTVTVPDHSHRQVPLKYPLLGQRRYLSQALSVHIRDETTVTEQEMGKWYEEYKASYTKPAEIAAHHIFLQTSDEVPTSSTAAQRKRIQKIKMEADQGTSFGLLAERYSEADSREQGGGIGRIVQGRPAGPQNRRINPKLEEALFKLKEGQVSDIISTSHGLHLLYARTRTEAVVPTLEELKARGLAGRDYRGNRMKENTRRRLESARSKSGARILTSKVEDITTGTPIIQLGDAQLTLAHIEAIYDRLFTRQWLRVRESQEQTERLLEQVLEDLLFAQAAEDEGLDQKPEIKMALDTIRLRHHAQKKLQAVTAEAYPVTEEQLKRLYEEGRDALRQPEAEGEVLVVSTVPYPDAPSQVRATREAQKIADLAHKQMTEKKDISLESLVASLPKSDDVITSWSVVPRHKLGSAQNFHMTAFDQSQSGLLKKGDISAVIKVGEAFAITRLGERYPGEPPSMDYLRENLVNAATGENNRRMRKDLIDELKSKGLLTISPQTELLKEDGN